MSKATIHPDYGIIHVTCSCGNKFDTGSTLSAKKADFHIEICSECHPFYTGQSTSAAITGRGEQYANRYANFNL